MLAGPSILKIVRTGGEVLLSVINATVQIPSSGLGWEYSHFWLLIFVHSGLLLILSFLCC